MNKQEFLRELEQGLSGLPREDAAERLSFYSEMIDDRVEEGLSEAEAVAGIGSVREIVDQTLADIPLTKLVKEKLTPKRSMRGWEILLLVLGFPLWFPLLVAAGAVVLALYVFAWSLILALWAVEAALFACALAGAAAAVLYFLHGQKLAGCAILGAGLVCAGLAILLFRCCVSASKGILRLTAKAGLGLKARFLRKERSE